MGIADTDGAVDTADASFSREIAVICDATAASAAARLAPVANKQRIHERAGSK